MDSVGTTITLRHNSESGAHAPLQRGGCCLRQRTSNSALAVRTSRRFPLCHALGLKSYFQHPGDRRAHPHISAADIVWAIVMSRILRVTGFLRLEWLVHSPARTGLKLPLAMMSWPTAPSVWIRRGRDWLWPKRCTKPPQWSPAIRPYAVT